MWRGAVLALAVVIIMAVMATPSQAQYYRGAGYRGPVVMTNYGSLPNPNWYVAPGLRINQAAYNIRVLGNAYSSVPPYALGYNPYPQVVNYGPVYPNFNTINPYVRPYPVYPYDLYGPAYPY
jgi:hypothetical protein